MEGRRTIKEVDEWRYMESDSKRSDGEDCMKSVARNSECVVEEVEILSAESKLDSTKKIWTLERLLMNLQRILVPLHTHKKTIFFISRFPKKQYYLALSSSRDSTDCIADILCHFSHLTLDSGIRNALSSCTDEKKVNTDEKKASLFSNYLRLYTL